MKLISLLVLFLFALTGCSAPDECVGYNCVCPATGGCDYDCSPGGNECHFPTEATRNGSTATCP